MKTMMAEKFLLLVSILRVLTVSLAKDSFYTTNDNRFFIGPIDIPFGFREGGEFMLNVENFKATSSIEGKYELHPGFLLKRFESESKFYKFKDEIMDDPSICSFRHFIEGDSHTNSWIDDDNDDAFKSNEEGDEYFADMKGAEKGGIFELSHKFGKGEAGLYFLIYQLCRPADTKGFMSKKMRSKFTLELKHINYDRLGYVSYLTAGEMPLPHLFLYFSISYGILTCFWLNRTKNIMKGKEVSNDEVNRPTVYAIHHLMSLVLILKTSSMLFESIRYHFIRMNGHAAVWSLMYYITVLLGSALLFTVLLLLGSGWSFFKSVLRPREKTIILVVLVLQALANIALIFLNVETEGERFYKDWSTILHLFDILCCCAVLVPIVWQINALEKDAEAEGNESGDAAHVLAKVQLFRSFYLLVVGYIYFTRVAVYIFAAQLSYEHTWMQYCFTELGTLVFFIAIGTKFKPVSEQFYSHVPTDDVEEMHSNTNDVSPSLEMVGDEV